MDTSSRLTRAENSPLVSARELSDIIGRPRVRVFDVRGRWGQPASYDEYLAGHIPGAAFLDWTKTFVEQDVPISLASVCGAEAARRSFADLGIDRGDTVVVYDDYHHMLAGRVWWAMRHWGFEDVRVLDGGWKGWTSLGLPVSVETPDTKPRGNFEPRAADDAICVGVEEIVAEAGTACLLDARGAKGYAGTPGDPRSGHIPGAINLPYSEALDKDTGLFLGHDALSRLFDSAVRAGVKRP